MKLYFSEMGYMLCEFIIIFLIFVNFSSLSPYFPCQYYWIQSLTSFSTVRNKKKQFEYRINTDFGSSKMSLSSHLCKIIRRYTAIKISWNYSFQKWDILFLLLFANYLLLTKYSRFNLISFLTVKCLKKSVWLF